MYKCFVLYQCLVEKCNKIRMQYKWRLDSYIFRERLSAFPSETLTMSEGCWINYLLNLICTVVCFLICRCFYAHLTTYLEPIHVETKRVIYVPAFPIVIVHLICTNLCYPSFIFIHSLLRNHLPVLCAYSQDKSTQFAIRVLVSCFLIQLSVDATVYFEIRIYSSKLLKKINILHWQSTELHYRSSIWVTLRY